MSGYTHKFICVTLRVHKPIVELVGYPIKGKRLASSHYFKAANYASLKNWKN